MALTIQDKAVEIAKARLIAGATGQGGSPGQLYKPPVTNPGRGEAVYGTEKDGQRFFEFLKAMMIDPANNIRKTGGSLGNDDSYGRGNVPGHPDWKISAGPQLPNFKPMGRVIKGVREGVLPLKDTKIKQNLQIGPQAELNPNQLKILKEIPSNLNEKPSKERLKIMKDITGRVLKAKNELPGNNRRSLGSTGHMTIPDPDNKGRLKIIDLLGPQPPQA